MRTQRITGRVLVAGRGRSGVAVSNGQHVVRTGRGGQYELAVNAQRHRVVFVTTPSGASPAESFFYRVDALPEDSVDFHLQPDPTRQQSTFSFAHMTDMHLSAPARDRTGTTNLRNALRMAFGDRRSKRNPDFAVITGDLTQRGDEPSLKAWCRTMRACPLPYLPMYAGHDGNWERHSLKLPPSFIRNYTALVGPAYYSFDWGGWHFALCTNEDHMFSKAEARMKNAWLRRDLEAHAHMPTLVFIHWPPTRRFLNSLVGTKVAAVFHGDTHASKVFNYRGIDVFVTPPFPFGGGDCSPRGYRRVTVSRGKVACDYVPLAHKGYQPALARPRSQAKRRSLRLLWSHRIGGIVCRAAPVVSHGRVLVSLHDDDRRGRQGVIALDLDSGKPKWRCETDASINGSVAVNQEGLAAALSVIGGLSAIDTRNGRTIWQRELPAYPNRWLYASPVVQDDVVYAGGKGGYGAFDLRTGRRCWYAHPHPHVDYEIKWCSHATPVIADGPLILIAQLRGLLALSCDTGEEQWCSQADVTPMDPAPAVIDGTIAFGVQGGIVRAVNGKTGRRIWQRQVTQDDLFLNALHAEGEQLLCSAPEGYCQLLSPKTGRAKWRYRVGPELLAMTPGRRPDRCRSAFGGPVTSHGHVALGAGDGYLHLLDAKTGHGRCRWWFGSPVTGVTAAGDRLLVVSYDGLVACFEIL